MAGDALWHGVQVATASTPVAASSAGVPRRPQPNPVAHWTEPVPGFTLRTDPPKVCPLMLVPLPARYNCLAWAFQTADDRHTPWPVSADAPIRLDQTGPRPRLFRRIA